MHKRLPWSCLLLTMLLSALFSVEAVEAAAKKSGVKKSSKRGSPSSVKGAETSSLNEACRRPLIILSDLAAIRVKHNRPDIAKPPSEFMLKLHPGLVGLSGKLVLNDTLHPDTPLRKMFTCSSCGRPNNLALQLETKEGHICAECGNFKDASDEGYYYYPRDGDKELFGFHDLAQLMTEKDQKAFFADHFVCSVCRTDVVDGSSFCPQCNAFHNPGAEEVLKAAGESEKINRKLRLARTQKGRDQLSDEETLRRAKDFVDAMKTKASDWLSRGAYALKESPQFVQDHVKELAMGAGVLTTVYAVWYFFFETKEYPAELIETKWVKTVYIEELTTVQEEDWCEDVPSRARDVVNHGLRRYSMVAPLTGAQKFWSWVQHLNFFPLATAKESKSTSSSKPYFRAGDAPNRSKPQSEQPRSRTSTAAPGRSSNSWGGGSTRSWGNSTSENGDYEHEDEEIDLPPPPPVYKDWCSYSIDKYKTVGGPQVFSGTNPASVADMAYPSEALKQNQRYDVSTKLTWTIRYQSSDGKFHTDSVKKNEANFMEHPVGFRATATVNRVGSIQDFPMK